MPTEKQLANLRPFEKGLPEKTQRDIQKKGSKKGNEAKRQYASLRECFRERLDDEKKDEIFDMLMDLALKKKNLNALDRLTKILGEDQEEQNKSNDINITWKQEMSDYAD